MKKSLLLLIALLPMLMARGQSLHCLTAESNRAYIKQLHLDRQQHAEYRTLTTFTNRSIAVYVHILVVNNTPTSTPGQWQAAVDQANQYFSPANMHFTICGFDYVVLGLNQAGWGPGILNYLHDNYDRYGYINLYSTDYFPYGAGLATFPAPGSPDQVVLANEVFGIRYTPQMTGGILAHELGHIFSLIHTHANMGGAVGTDEFVDGSNCTTAGDYICDTPADPNLQGIPNRVDSLCNYTDSVYTDAHGDLFHPDTRNIMSYSRLACYDHFSNQQLLQMRYCLDNVRYYLRSGSLNLVVTNHASRVCSYEPPFVLTPVPAGGVLSGQGVSGNVFSPAAAGPGTHLITYTLPGIADTVSTSDQYATYPDTSRLLQTFTQTFSAGVDARLQGVSLYLNNPVSQQVIVQVYQGPVAGTLLAQDTVLLPADTTTRWFDLDLTSVVAQQNSSWYTLRLQFAQATTVYGSYSNRYDGGQGDSLTDVAFVTRVLPYDANCGANAYIAFSVIEPAKPGFEDFVTTFCVNAPAVTFQGRPAGGVMEINGIHDSIFDPAIRGIGFDTLHYTVVDYYGCHSDTTALIQVIDDQVTLTPINGTYCPDELSAPVTGNPAGGDYYLDGAPFTASQIDFSQLNAGAHTLSYAFHDSLPYLNVVDVSTIDTAFVNSVPVGDHFPIYQSFKANTSGYLNRIYFRWASNNPVMAQVRVFSGPDTNGVLLYVDSAEIGQGGYYNTNVWFTRDHIRVTKDSVYCFCFVAQMTAAVTQGGLYLTADDHYPDGMCSYAWGFLPPGRDLYFMTYVDPLYSCASDSVSTSFTVSAPPVVHLGNDTILPAGQSLTLDAGSGGVVYTWSDGSHGQTLLVQTSGIYSVVVMNADGCTGTDTIAVNFVTGIDEINTTYVTIRPNPGNQLFTVETSAHLEALQLFDLSGREVHMQQLQHSPNQTVIETGALAAGIYQLHVLTDTGTATVRLVVN